MLEFLKTLNTDYGNLLMFAVPLATVSYAYHEYRLKRQPVVLPELTYAEPMWGVYLICISGKW